MENKKIPYLKLIPVITIALILYKVINNIELFIVWLGYLLGILSYVFWAVAIAYLLNPLMVFLEKRFKMRRYVSLPILYVFFAGIITFFVLVISPIIVRNIYDLLENIPVYLVTTRDWVNNTIAKADWIGKYEIDAFIVENLSYIMDKANGFLDSTLKMLISNAITATSTLIRFIFGSMISIYLLKDKELLIRNFRRFFYAFLNEKKAERLLDVGGKVNYMFSRFLVGKTVDSIIIGALCFGGMLLLKVPYALLISLIVGITNMIPYLGPIFGAIPAVILTLFSDPVKAFWVLIIILALQQFDGWILGPKILGDSVGLSPIWIIVAILVGGGLFGIVGMLLGVPIAAVIKVLLTEAIGRKLKAKNLEIDQ